MKLNKWSAVCIVAVMAMAVSMFLPATHAETDSWVGATLAAVPSQPSALDGCQISAGKGDTAFEEVCPSGRGECQHSISDSDASDQTSARAGSWEKSATVYKNDLFTFVYGFFDVLWPILVALASVGLVLWQMYGSLVGSIDGSKSGLEDKLTGEKTALEAKLTGVKTELEGKLTGERTALEAKLTGEKTALEAKLTGVKTELKDDIRELKAEIKSDIRETKAELKDDIGKLEGKLTGVKTELKDDIGKLEGKLDKLEGKLESGLGGVKTDIQALLGQISLLSGQMQVLVQRPPAQQQAGAAALPPAGTTLTQASTSGTV